MQVKRTIFMSLLRYNVFCDACVFLNRLEYAIQRTDWTHRALRISKEQTSRVESKLLLRYMLVNLFLGLLVL